MSVIALVGAGGKMGCRIADNLKTTDHDVHYVEIAEQGVANLSRRGLSVTPLETALREVEAVILAVPDVAIRTVTARIVPQLPAGAMLIVLDPAAPYSGVLPDRADITYLVTHPCHPPVINDETDPEARRDFFGGIRAKQNVVCALMQGPESDYRKGERIVRQIFAPVVKVHRITVEQMAILEPAMAETVTATLMVAIREALDEAVRAGVPEEAARDFMLGHINANLGILFGLIDAEFSDGAKQAIARAKQVLLQPDWKKVFDIESIRQETKAITDGISRS